MSISCKRQRGVFLLFTVVLSEPRRDRGTRLWISGISVRMHSMEISRGPKTGCSPFSECLKVGFPVQNIHQGSKPFLFFPSPLFQILITLAILSSWSQDDDDDDSINNNNYYYYNGKDTWSELLCANHRSKPLPYFYSLNIHINQGRYHYFSFKDGETEAKRDSVTCPKWNRS